MMERTKAGRALWGLPRDRKWVSDARADGIGGALIGYWI